MDILWWLAPPAVATGLAMLWAAWAGRGRDTGRDQSDAARQRMAVAIARELPQTKRPQRLPTDRHVRRVEPSTGVVVRPSQSEAQSGTQSSGESGRTRHSA